MWDTNAIVQVPSLPTIEYNFVAHARLKPRSGTICLLIAIRPMICSHPNWIAKMRNDELKLLNQKLERLLSLVERAVPAAKRAINLDKANAFVWEAESGSLVPVAKVNRVEMKLLKGIDHVRDILVENTQRFASGYAANNALLWGARGMGKSSLVKAVHDAINTEIRNTQSNLLKLVEIHREDINSLPSLLGQLRTFPYRIILFCDDLSFDNNDTSYKSLKAALDGGIEGRPDNVIFYATSNRRHLLARDMIENERSTAISPAEAVEEKVSLSDRFGLWLGFHNCSQAEYLEMINAYAMHFKLDVQQEKLRANALEWSATRGARSGRVAWQFIQDLGGKMGKKL